MAKYREDIEILGNSEEEGYRWTDKATGKTWAIPSEYAGFIIPSFLSLPSRPESDEDRAIRKGNLVAAIEFAKQRNNPIVVAELERVLSKL